MTVATLSTTSARPAAIVASDVWQVRKRDDRLVPYDEAKVVRAIGRCLTSPEVGWNDDNAGHVAGKVARAVSNRLRGMARLGQTQFTVEEIQQLVIGQLWAEGLAEPATQYTLYREQRRQARMVRPITAELNAIYAADRSVFLKPSQAYQFYSKFSRWREQDKRRETWREAITRVMGWFKALPVAVRLRADEWDMLDAALHNMEASCALRVLQMAGPALDRCHVGAYNCAYLPLQDWRAFAELLYILMQGTGCGFSVEMDYVSQLPRIRKQKKHKTVHRYIVEDYTESWCDAFLFGLQTWTAGDDVTYDTSRVRKKNTPLKTKGGRASGPEPLHELLDAAREIMLRRQGGYLTDLDAHDLGCHTGNIGSMGGVRRAAEISLSDRDSELMATAKSGDWWPKYKHREMANNSAVYDEKPTAEEFMREFLTLVESRSGERGIFNRAGVVKNMPARRNKKHRFGTNPSLRAGTRVYTTEGIVPIEQLDGREFQTHNLAGKVRRARCRLSGKAQPLYAVRLAGGHTYYATAEHEWPVWTGAGNYTKTKTTALAPGARLPVVRQTKLGFGTAGDYETGLLAGWLLGDGCVTQRADNEATQFGICLSEEKHTHIGQRLQKTLAQLGCEAQFQRRERDGAVWYELCSQNKAVTAWLREIGFSGKEHLPDAAWTASDAFRAGLVDGLFSSDGCVSADRRSRGTCITLTSSRESLVRDVAELLGFYGIRSRVRVQTITKASFPNGKDYGRSYRRCDLRISAGADVRWFAIAFTLSLPRKRLQLEAAVAAPTTVHWSDNTIGVIAVEATDLREDVWDIGVDDVTHCFRLGHCITGNCAEIILRPFAFCNLSIAIARHGDSEADLERKVLLATYFGALQSTCTNFGYLRPEWRKNAEEERLLGVDITGHADCPLLHYGAPGRAALLQRLARVVAATADELSQRFGINRSAADTCVKPGGDSSVLFDCGSGVSPRFATHYLRRCTEDKGSPVAKLLVDAGMAYMEKPGNPSQLLFEFPLAAPPGAETRNKLSAMEQLENWLEWRENWAEHSVSVSIYVGEDEWIDVQHWCYRHFDKLTGLAFFPRDNGIYRGAPLEELTAERFAELTAKVPEINWAKLVQYETEDQTVGSQTVACHGGSCERI